MRAGGRAEVAVPAAVQAGRRAALAARVPASVTELPYEEGQWVKAGAVVVRLDDAVAAVAVNTWAAKQGLAAAAPQWDAGPNAKVSTADIVAQLVSASEKPGAVARHEGDAEGAMTRAARRITVTCRRTPTGFA